MALPFYARIRGDKQGDFKGESSSPQRSGWIECLDFALEVDSPIDMATGQASGKRQWRPIEITKKRGASSPQFLQALVTNEVLSTVLLEFEAVLKDGMEGTYYVIQLTDALVTGVRQYIGSARGESTVDTLELERIALTFRQITCTYKDGNITSIDEWKP